MAFSNDEIKKIYEDAQRAAAENAARSEMEKAQGQNNEIQKYKVWTDAFGNVNRSNITSGETERHYNNWGSPLKNASKDDFAADVGQAASGALTRQESAYKSALGTLGLGVASLFKGKDYQPEVGSGLWKLLEGAEASQGASNRLLQDSKTGRGFAGGLAMDLTAGAVDLIGDQMLNLVVPGAGGAAGLAAMAVRSFGGTAEEQREQGASIGTQFLKGLKSASIELATESMWKIGGRGAGGEGWAQGLIDQGFANVAKRGGNVFLAKMLTAFGTEAVEEMASDLLNPVADKLLAGIFKGDYEPEALASLPEILYDGLVGGVLGLLGGTTEGISAQAQLKSMGAEGYSNMLLEQMEEGRKTAHKKKDAANVRRAFALGFISNQAKQVAGKILDSMSKNKGEASSSAAEAATSVTPQNAAGEQSDIIHQTTPEAEPLAPNAASPEFNSKAEAQPAATPEPEITPEPTEVPEETASKVAAQPQEGQDNGKTGIRSEAPGRQDSANDGRPEQSRSQENPEGGASAAGGKEVGEARKNPSREEKLRRVGKARDSVEKRAAGKYKAVAEQTLATDQSDAINALERELRSRGVTEEQIEQALEDEAMASAIDLGELEGQLRSAGIDEATIKDIVKEVYEGEDMDVPFAFGSDEFRGKRQEADTLKPTTDKRTPETKGNIEFSRDEKGRGVATVTKQGNKFDQKITRDVDTVKMGEKFVKTDIDTQKRGDWFNGTRIYQRGVGDDYFVVNRDGIVVARVSSWGQARQIAKGKGNYWNAIKLGLGGNLVWNNSNGECVFDTTKAFTGQDGATIITQGRSLASDELGVVLNKHARTGFSGATNTNILYLDISTNSFDYLLKKNGGNFTEKQVQKMQMQAMRRLLVGEKNTDGTWKHRPGLTGTDGRHYVFAGQTSSMRKNGVIVLMEEGKYNAFRKKMVGGLSPEEIEKFNPAKYLTNQGTVFTPSEADTGIKGKDILVAGEIYKIFHDVQRTFLRTTDIGLDTDTLEKSLYSKELRKLKGNKDNKLTGEALEAAAHEAARKAAKKMLEKTKIGEAILVTCDLITKATDGTGFTRAGQEMQVRGYGGIKGFLEQCDFVKMYEDVIPFGSDPFVWHNDNGEISGGIRYVDRAKGVEMMNKWGKWQALKDVKAIMFESMVKFANNYTVRDSNGNVDAEASTAKFYESVGNSDIRRIPLESLFGYSEDSGMVEGYTAKSMEQLLRSQEGVSRETLKQIIVENGGDAIRAVMKDEKSMARALGVNFDSNEPPASSDVRAAIAWFFGPDFFKTNLGKKWAYEKAVKIAEDVRGGKLYLKDGEHSYQWIAPDPFGLTNLMTQFVYQGNEERILGAKDYAKSQNTAFSTSSVLRDGEVYSSKLGSGNTAIGRFPSIESNDVQVRKNRRTKAYEELREKYGVGDKAMFVALNDTLALNLDNDFDGDTVLAFQGALEKAISEARDYMGKKKDARRFTEFTHGSGRVSETQAADYVYASVKLALDADNVGRFDNYIEYLQAMPDEWLEEPAKEAGMSVKDYRAKLQMTFSAAYKLNFDYAKNAQYDPEFAKVVVDCMKQLGDIAKSRGYYVDDEGLYGSNPLESYTSFFAVPGWWKYSNNANKYAKYLKAIKFRGKAKNGAILPGGDNLMSQIYTYGPLVKATADDYSARKAFIQGTKKEGAAFPYPYKTTAEELTQLSSIDTDKYASIKPEFFLKLAKVYVDLVNNAGSESESARNLQQLYDICNFDDPAQFQSVMTYALESMGALDPSAGWMWLLNFKPVSEIFKRNARVLGSISKASNMMVSLREDMYSAMEHTDKARKAVQDLKAERADLVDLKNQLRNEFDAVASEVSWLDSLFKRLKFSEESFKSRVASVENVAALMGEQEQLEAFSRRLGDYEVRLNRLDSDLIAKYDEETDNASRIAELNHEVRDAMKEYRKTVESVNVALKILNNEFETWREKHDEGTAKQWFYGIQTDAPSGLESDRERARIEAKVDEMLVRKGIALAGSVASPEFELAVLGSPDIKIVQTKDGYEYRLDKQKAPPKQKENKQPPDAPPTPPQQKAPAPADSVPSEPAPAPPTQNQQEQKADTVSALKPRKETFPRRLERIDKAVKSVGKLFGRSAMNIVPDDFANIVGEKFGQARADMFNFGQAFIDAYAAEDNGASLRELAKTLPEKAKGSAALQTLLGKDENSNAFKAAKRLAEAENAMAFEDAAAEFAEIIEKESAEFKNTVETITAWKKNIESRGKVAKFLSGDNFISRALSTYTGYMRDIVNIAMGLDNFRRKGNGPGYRLAKMILDSEFNGATATGNAAFTVGEAKQRFDKSDSSGKTVELSFIKNKEAETHSVSMAVAVDFLHTIETLKASKIDAWKNVIYLVGDERIRLTQPEQYNYVYKTLKDAVEGDENAKAYYDAFTEAYDMFKDPTKVAVKDASGRTVEMYEDGSYYPISTNATGKVGPKDYNFGMDDARYTKSRIKIDGGIINVFDPAARFNSYMNTATKVITRAQVGAALERLGRGGIVDSLEDIVTERYGKGYADVIRQATKDANDFRGDTDDASSFLRNLRLNIQTGALFGNFGSMLKQFPSVFNAVGVLDFDDIMAGVTSLANKDSRTKAKEVGAIRSRFNNNFDPDVKDAFDNGTAFAKFWKNASKKASWLSVLSDGFQRVDSNAVKAIYLASRNHYLKQGLTEADDGFEDKVLAIFKEAFLLTQPQFDKLMRPYVQTSENELVRMFGMFKTQPLRNLNTMIRAVEEYKADRNDKSTTPEQLADSSKRLAATIAGQATASLLFAALGVLAKGFYHRTKKLEDEEGKLDPGKVMAQILMNAAEATGGMTVLGDSAVQFAIDALSGGKTKEFYGLNAGTASSVKSAVDAVTKFVETPNRYNAKVAATDIATLLGIPLSNAYSIVNSAIMYAKDAGGTNDGNYDDILKYLDAQAKQAKRDEEKQKKSGATDGATMLAEAAKADASQSELNSAGKENEVKVGRYLTKPYNALLETGVSAQDSQYILSFIDTDNNDRIKQSELIAFYRDNPDYEAYAEAMWNSYGWKTTWEQAKKKAG